MTAKKPEVCTFKAEGCRRHPMDAEICDESYPCFTGHKIITTPGGLAIDAELGLNRLLDSLERTEPAWVILPDQGSK